MAAVTEAFWCGKREHAGIEPFFFFNIILYGMIFSIFLISHDPTLCDGVQYQHLLPVRE